MSDPTLDLSGNNMNLIKPSEATTKLAEQAGAFTQRSLDVVRDGAQLVRDQAQRAQDGTVHYIQSEPVKAMLIAAGAGAALMALLHLMTGPRYR
jgi:ElaB/YqjD/DUF883 family membrane-anchored ribosome-binding protein